MNISEKIKELRSQKGLSVRAFAEKIGVSKSALSRWENGTSKPDVEKVQILADIANVSLLQFIGEEEKEDVRECLNCGELTGPSFSFCPSCGEELFKINYDQCELILLHYFQINKLIFDAEDNALHPFIDLTKRKKGTSSSYVTNKEEVKALKFAESYEEVKRLEDLRNKVGNIINDLDSIELKVIRSIYCTGNMYTHSYVEVYKTTGIDYKLIKEIDLKVKKLVGKYLRH